MSANATSWPFSERVAAATWQASFAERTPADRAASSRSVLSRRSPSSRPVVSLTMQKMPPTLPVSSRTGS